MTAIHPNLRPPWPKGVSGNPAGRRLGSRNRRNITAERIGRRLFSHFPAVAAALEVPALDDRAGWRRLYRETLAECRARGLGENAQIATVRRLLGSVLLRMRLIPTSTETICCYCGRPLTKGRLAYSISQGVPVFAGQ
jgi:hypothetical protein